MQSEETNGFARYFLAKADSDGSTPALDREVSSEGEALVEALRSGVTYYAIQEFRVIPDFCGQKAATEKGSRPRRSRSVPFRILLPRFKWRLRMSTAYFHPTKAALERLIKIAQARYRTEPEDGRVLAELVERRELRRLRSDHAVGSGHTNRCRHGDGVRLRGGLPSLPGRSWVTARNSDASSTHGVRH